MLPLCLVAVGGQRLVGRLRGRGGAAARPALGALMIGAGVMIALGVDTRLTTYVVRDLPAYTDTLQALERTAAVDRNAGDEPLTLASLRGRVVLLDFWTYSCINCLRTIPHLEALHERYRDSGLTVLGVHTPVFAFEADPGNVADAIRDLGITYPVALDPDFATWDAFGNRYWPATYLIDRDGHVRDLHIGEGDEARTQALVRRALGLPAGSPRAGDDGAEASPAARDQTPETYAGAARIQRLVAGQRVRPMLPTRYSAPGDLPADHLALDGEWTIGDEKEVAGRGAALELSFRARGVYLVLDGDGESRSGRVLLDGRAPAAGQAGSDLGPGGALTVYSPRLYRLLQLPERREGRIRIELAPGTRAYAFTFG